MGDHSLQLIADNHWAACLAALLVEAAIGGRRLLGRLPGPDGVLIFFESRLHKKLNRPGRSAADLGLRGLLTLTAIAVTAGFLGLALDGWTRMSAGWTLFGLFILTCTLGARPALDTGLEVARRLVATEDKVHSNSKNEEGRFAAARWTIERLANRFCDGLWANGFWFVVGGFAGLLAYRAVAMAVARSAPKGVFASASAYDRGPTLAYQLLTLIPGILSALILSIAAAFVAGTRRIWPWTPFAGAPAGVIWSRYWPVNGFAHALRLALPGASAGSGPRWLGPEDGIARARAKDIRRALALFATGWLITLGVVAAALYVDLSAGGAS